MCSPLPGAVASRVHAGLRRVHVGEQGPKVRARAGEGGRQQVVHLRHVPGEQGSGQLRDGGRLAAVDARPKRSVQVRRLAVLVDERTDQLAATGLRGRRPAEGAFLRLCMGRISSSK